MGLGEQWFGPDVCLWFVYCGFPRELRGRATSVVGDVQRGALGRWSLVENKVP